MNPLKRARDSLPPISRANHAGKFFLGVQRRAKMVAPSTPAKNAEPKPALRRNGYSAAERAAIEAAEAAGKVTRIENGEWPDLGRPQVVRFKSPRRRAMLKAGTSR
jgi:hypothetical protein